MFLSAIRGSVRGTLESFLRRDPAHADAREAVMAW